MAANLRPVRVAQCDDVEVRRLFEMLVHQWWQCQSPTVPSVYPQWPIRKSHSGQCRLVKDSSNGFKMNLKSTPIRMQWLETIPNGAWPDDIYLQSEFESSYTRLENWPLLWKKRPYENKLAYLEQSHLSNKLQCCVHFRCTSCPS